MILKTPIPCNYYYPWSSYGVVRFSKRRALHCLSCRTVDMFCSCIQRWPEMKVFLPADVLRASQKQFSDLSQWKKTGWLAWGVCWEIVKWLLPATNDCRCKTPPAYSRVPISYLPLLIHLLWNTFRPYVSRFTTAWHLHDQELNNDTCQSLAKTFLRQ